VEAARADARRQKNEPRTLQITHLNVFIGLFSAVEGCGSAGFQGARGVFQGLAGGLWSSKVKGPTEKVLFFFQIAITAAKSGLSEMFFVDGAGVWPHTTPLFIP
jgi:hypothetical protein